MFVEIVKFLSEITKVRETGDKGRGALRVTSDQFSSSPFLIVKLLGLHDFL